VEFGLAFHLSAELDAFYRRAVSSNPSFSIGASSYSSRRADVLEFPLQLKRRLHDALARPFSPGLAVVWVRHASGLPLSCARTHRPGSKPNQAEPLFELLF
jgi:hypothetical protein